MNINQVPPPPLKKHILRKKEVIRKSLYNPSQPEESAGPQWDLLNGT